MKAALNVDMVAFRSGDRKSFEEVFNFYFPILTYFANQLLNDDILSEDKAIEALERIWHKRADIKTPNNIKALLYITTKNLCFNYLRHLKVKRISHFEIRHLFDHHYEDHVLRSMIKSEILVNVFLRMKHLSAQQKQIIKLRYVEGKDIGEVADILDLSPSTVKTQQLRALTYLRQALN